MRFDTVSNILRRLLDSVMDNPIEVVIELLLIGVSVNWCAGVLHGTRGTRLLRGLLVLLITATLGVQLVASSLDWSRLELLYRTFVIGLAVIALVAFQPELRRALIRAGDVRLLRRASPRDRLIASLIEATGYLSRNKYGAIIAIQREIGLANWTEHGTQINADATADLIKSIFFPKSPLHDLGIVVRGNRILAAGCQFPVAESGEVEGSLGSRHRAAVGLSMESDALVLIVSEETGTLSIADRGVLHRFLSLDDLAEELSSRLNESAHRRRSLTRRSARDVWLWARRALVVIPLSLIIWFLADQASMVEAENIEIQLVLSSEATQQIDVLSPQPTRFRIDVRGAQRAIDRLHGELRSGALVWKPRGPFAGSGPHRLSDNAFAQTLEGLDALKSIDVQSVTPAELRYFVDERVSLVVPIELRSGDVRLRSGRVEPQEVTVTLRASHLARIRSDHPVLALSVAALFDGVTPGASKHFDDVPLPREILGVEILSVSPSTVSVSGEVMDQQVRRVVEGVRATLSVAPTLFDRIVVEARDQNEWLRAIEIEGERSLVSSITPADIVAVVELTPETALSSDEYRPFNVRVRLPVGAVLTGAPPIVYLRVRDRNGS